MRYLVKYLFRGLALIFAPVVLYLFFAVLFSLIPVNRTQNVKEGVEIFIRTNGVHVQVILPVKTAYYDWSEEFYTGREMAGSISYISFGWGDRNFFAKTPEWSDLTFPVAFKALFLKSPTAMHVDFYSTVQTNKRCKRLLVAGDQYGNMVRFIDASFCRDDQRRLIPITGLHYTFTDCFYEATGSYNLFVTCNTWTNRCLKSAGLKACLWTPFDRGILFHYRND